MPHFFIKSKNINNGSAVINDKENYIHIAKSLRARIGERLLLIDERQIQHETVIDKITASDITVKIEKSYESKRKLDFQLFLAQSPLRSDAQTIIIEKATELGAAGIYPIYTDNCALNKSVIEKKIPKWNKIMYEASKQCERADIPETYDFYTLDNLFSSQKFDKIIAFTERKSEMTLHKYIENNPIKPDESIIVIIGPEGGFSEKEFQFFAGKKIPMLTLGELILKAETAVITALGNLIYEYENYK